MTLAVVLLILVIGSVIFHFASPWWFTDIAANWESIDFAMDLTLWASGIAFIVINLFLIYCIYKFQQKEGHKAVYEPENTKLEVYLGSFTAVGIVALLGPGLFVWALFVNVPEDATEMEVLGQQWQWQYRYPGADGLLGTADVQFVSESNPFGINPEDPNGQDDILVNDPNMRLPVGQPVKVLLRSTDVLHNYSVAQFRVKMDIVPGQTTYLWFEPTETGTFDLFCEEYCGIAHFTMRGAVIVETQAEYDAWLAAQPTFTDTQNAPAANTLAGQTQYAVCATCHGAQGEGNQALNGPKLAGLQAWYIERQIRYFQDGVRGGEGDTNGQTMAPMANSLADDAAIRNVAAYIASLPDNPASPTVSGDVDNGYHIYDRNCAACHLDDGSGNWYTEAPKLAGMSDWYFVTQISNFRAGIRGLHRSDDYGEQMVQMATAMSGLEEIQDVAAYINQISGNN
ncbi:MAG: c-type cytochrome [Gammaproteobacteria bacterium]|jgi:cytochrome c oxidase subunit 2|nr:c-type cytochrome [Gammaproteobacteria bacterium]MDP6732604.1 c-type cytochrome [Gammaproteobacteria bacterium]